MSRNGEDITQSGGDCDQDIFRNVIGHFASGVTIITSRHDGTDYGMTASAVSSLSMDPPMLLVCVNDRNPTAAAITQSGAFAVNILKDSQAHLAEQFGRPGEDKFNGIETHYGRFGEPYLSEALAYMECEVKEDVRGGTHHVYLSEVKNAVAQDGHPLTYFRGTFGRFLQAEDESLYQDLRQLVLSREMAVGRHLDIQDLADRMSADPGAVYHALTRIASEGLLERQSGGGYNVVALEAHTLAQAAEARLVMELGVAESTVGKVSDESIATLAELADATAEFVVDGRLDPIEDYLTANRAFHEHHVGMVGNEALLTSYRRLGLEGIMLRSLQMAKGGGASTDQIDDHRALVAGYEESDLEQVKAVIRRHAARSREIGRKALEAAGGSL
jgi:flavin reductase (DIM6/NTAB) family NADH-FMN oxidoreductase RutF/DNA-binding GntR family transcriptional regulator